MSEVRSAPSATASSRAPSPWDGQFFWYELMTTDPAAAIDFYREVVGWSAAEAGPNSGYTVFSAGERGVAGAMALPEEVCAAGGRPGWLGYIHVADTDAMADRIAGAGGTVHRPPADIPTIGRFAVVADPGGAVFQIMSPFPQDDVPAPADPDAPGLVSWRELYSAAGQEASFAFYSAVFGWETLQEMPMGEMGVYRIFGRDGVQMGGMMDKPKEMPVSAWAYYFNVDDIDAAERRVRDRGGQVLMGPHEVPGGSWIIQGLDPQGANFALVGPRR